MMAKLRMTRMHQLKTEELFMLLQAQRKRPAVKRPQWMETSRIPHRLLTARILQTIQVKVLKVRVLRKILAKMVTARALMLPRDLMVRK